MKNGRANLRTFLIGVAAALSIPLAILNWTAVIIGGVWLAFYHQWGLIGAGIVVMLLGRFVLAVLMGIGILIAAPGIKMWETSRLLAWPFFIIASVYNFIVLTCWCVLIFYYCENRESGNVWPYILWAYATSTMTWVHMTVDEMKDASADGAITWTAGAQFGSLSIMASILVGNGWQTEFGMIVFFVPIALIGMAMTAFVERHRRQLIRL